MIALVLGLIVVSAVFNMYAGGTRSAQFTQGLQALQENGRYAVSAMRRSLQLAGYSPGKHIDAIDIAASDDRTLVIRLRQAQDCNGQPTTGTDGLAVNTYRYDSAMLAITCRGNSAGASVMTIVEGVDGFRVLYGVDADANDVPERYVAHSTSLKSDDISAIRFALLINSAAPIRAQARSRNHVLLDSIITKNDRLARQVFTGLVKLRNRPEALASR